MVVTLRPVNKHFQPIKAHFHIAIRGLCLLLSVNAYIDFMQALFGLTFFFDATNPEAQAFVWEQCRKNYYQYGIRCFWLDRKSVV